MKKKLGDEYPELVKEWDNNKNKDVGVYKIGPNSHYKANWICPYGHEYQARVSHRTRRNDGCPYCSGKKPILNFNDLKTIFPEIAEQWDYDFNHRRPEEFLPYSHYKASWICNNGHRFKANISDRTNKKVKCPYCYGRYPVLGETDLLTVYPELAEEWNYDKNGELQPENFTSQSNKKVWWLCSICENSWSAQINLRARGRGCPKCAKTLR